MVHKMTMTLQAAGLGRAGRMASAPVAPRARYAGALRRAVGFAITAGGFAVIAAHVLQRVAGG